MTIQIYSDSTRWHAWTPLFFREVVGLAESSGLWVCVGGITDSAADLAIETSRDDIRCLHVIGLSPKGRRWVEQRYRTEPRAEWSEVEPGGVEA